jgi:hypothetical protein
MRLKIVALLFLVSPLTIQAQYNGTYKANKMDISSYCTSGTNCWHNMGNGSGIYDGDEGGDGQIVVSITAGAVYVWNYSTRVWTQHSELGGGWTKIAVQDQYHVFMLGSGGSCTAPNRALYFWDGVHTPTLAGTKCLTGIYVSKYGTQALLEGVDSNGTGWDSYNNGSTWTQDANTTGITGMYANDESDWCIAKSGVLYTYQEGSNEGVVAFSPAPSGTVTGCVFVTTAFSGGSGSDTSSNILMAWNSAGTVQTYSFTGGTWSTISGLAATKVVGPIKGNIVAFSAGVPYHYNVIPPSVSLTMAGSWTGCPNAGQTCQPGVKHKVTAYLHHPHDLINSVASQEGNPADYISATSTAVSAKCDPFFGDPADVECGLTADPGPNNRALCEVSATTLATPPAVPQWAGSIDAKSFDGSILATYSVPLGPGGYITTVVCSATLDACKQGTLPTCPIVSVDVEEECGGLACNLAEEEADAQEKCSYGNQPASWVQITPYLKGIAGSCVYNAGSKEELVPESFGQIPCD